MEEGDGGSRWRMLCSIKCSLSKPSHGAAAGARQSMKKLINHKEIEFRVIDSLFISDWFYLNYYFEPLFFGFRQPAPTRMTHNIDLSLDAIIKSNKRVQQRGGGQGRTGSRSRSRGRVTGSRSRSRVTGGSSRARSRSRGWERAGERRSRSKSAVRRQQHLHGELLFSFVKWIRLQLLYRLHLHRDGGGQAGGGGGGGRKAFNLKLGRGCLGV